VFPRREVQRAHLQDLLPRRPHLDLLQPDGNSGSGSTRTVDRRLSTVDFGRVQRFYEAESDVSVMRVLRDEKPDLLPSTGSASAQ
jgi:hypothetical protein